MLNCQQFSTISQYFSFFSLLFVSENFFHKSSEVLAWLGDKMAFIAVISYGSDDISLFGFKNIQPVPSQVKRQKHLLTRSLQMCKYFFSFFSLGFFKIGKFNMNWNWRCRGAGVPSVQNRRRKFV